SPPDQRIKTCPAGLTRDTGYALRAPLADLSRSLGQRGHSRAERVVPGRAGCKGHIRVGNGVPQFQFVEHLVHYNQTSFLQLPSFVNPRIRAEILQRILVLHASSERYSMPETPAKD